ncbi:MAG TPA: NAD(P)-dependent oxidoreductase [Trueperaceae bacterium]
MSKDALPESVLVTGASGFLGQAVARALADAGVKIIATDVRERDGSIPVEALDLCDGEAVRALLARLRPCAVVHCAAFGKDAAGLLASAEQNPRRAVQVNVNAFSELLDACQAAGIRRVVWSSSTTVYGPPACYPGRTRVTEMDKPAPTSVYGATKMLAERVSALAFDPGRFEPVALRLPLVYGPGRWYGGAQARWMNFVRDAVAGRKQPYAFDTAPADWIYISDALDALRAALETPSLPHAVYNVEGTVTSPYDMAVLVAEFTQAGCQLERHDLDREIVLVDGSAFARDTAYAPKVPQRLGVQRFVEHLQNPNSGEKRE